MTKPDSYPFNKILPGDLVLQDFYANVFIGDQRIKYSSSENVVSFPYTLLFSYGRIFTDHPSKKGVFQPWDYQFWCSGQGRFVQPRSENPELSDELLERARRDAILSPDLSITTGNKGGEITYTQQEILRIIKATINHFEDQ